MLPGSTGYRPASESELLVVRIGTLEGAGAASGQSRGRVAADPPHGMRLCVTRGAVVTSERRG